MLLVLKETSSMVNHDYFFNLMGLVEQKKIYH